MGEQPSWFNGWTVADEVAGTANQVALTYENRFGNGYFAGTIVATTSVTAPSFIGNLSGNAATAASVPWSGVTGKPTTVAGYGITDFVSSNASSPVAADTTTTNGNYYVNSNISPLLGQSDG